MKPWHSKISKHIDSWSSRLSAHKWWPKFVYHFTDINNIPNILLSGKLYSRNISQALGLMHTDNASSDVINRTPADHKNFVRFYFRPKTPTQFRNEGIRPFSERWNNSHCPIPVFLFFDSFALMCRDDAKFSDGTMASCNVSYGPNEIDFESIPFNKVFHCGRYDPDVNPEIKFHRHAELLIPNEINLNNLCCLACRSHAERDTLIYLLSLHGLEAWNERIRIGDSTTFERKWTYIDRISVKDKILKFIFNNNSQCVNNFMADITIQYPSGKKWSIKKEMSCKTSYEIKFKTEYEYLNVQISLDNSLAYYNTIFMKSIY